MDFTSDCVIYERYLKAPSDKFHKALHLMRMSEPIGVEGQHIRRPIAL